MFKLILISALLFSVYAGQTSLMSSTFILKDNTVASVESSVEFNQEVSVSSYPNPFNPSTVISVNNLKLVDGVSLLVYDVKGRVVANLSSKLISGTNHITWNAKGFAGGIYFASLKYGSNKVLNNKMILIK